MPKHPDRSIRQVSDPTICPSANRSEWSILNNEFRLPRRTTTTTTNLSDRRRHAPMAHTRRRLTCWPVFEANRECSCRLDMRFHSLVELCCCCLETLLKRWTARDNLNQQRTFLSRIEDKMPKKKKKRRRQQLFFIRLIECLLVNSRFPANRCSSGEEEKRTVFRRTIPRHTSDQQILT